MIQLVIDHAKLRALREYAEAHPIPVEQMYAIARGELPPVGDREGYRCFLPTGFKVVFSVEDHPQRRGGSVRLRHLSVSLSEPTGTQVPSPKALATLCRELGFAAPLEQCFVRLEGHDPPYVEVMCRDDGEEERHARTR
jgi:hypothetical protein